MSSDKILAIDLGGTQFRVALADHEGKFLKRFSALTRAKEGHEQVLRRINKAVRELVADIGFGAIRGMGVAVAGPLNLENGVLIASPNMPGWTDIPLKQLWEEEFQLPVYVCNDASLAALGEHRYGAGRGIDNFIYITVSTGIGGGVIIDGRLYLGATGLAGEVGHMVIDPGGLKCGCGSTGCWETLASGSAIARSAVERIAGGAVSGITAMVGGDLGKVTAVTVEKAARSGDALAKDVMHMAGINLGFGVVNLILLFNPEAVIIGGGVSKAGELIFEPIRQVVAERVTPYLRREVPIIRAALGDGGGLLGAVALVLEAPNPLAQRRGGPH